MARAHRLVAALPLEASFSESWRVPRSHAFCANEFQFHCPGDDDARVVECGRPCRGWRGRVDRRTCSQHDKQHDKQHGNRRAMPRLCKRNGLPDDLFDQPADLVHVDGCNEDNSHGCGWDNGLHRDLQVNRRVLRQHGVAYGRCHHRGVEVSLRDQFGVLQLYSVRKLLRGILGVGATLVCR